MSILEKDKPKDLLALEDIKPLYFLPRENLAEEVLIPAYRFAEKADCMVGFFSSGSLSSLAPGLATYINNSTHSFRLIISPFLSSEDREAIEKGIRSCEEVVDDLLSELFITEDLLHKHTLKCLSYLLRIDRIQIKVALLENALFHPKVWIFEKNNFEIAVHGSSNLTYSGINRNFEQISVSKSWLDPAQKYTVEKFRYQFDRLWKNKEDNCVVISISQAIRNRILQTPDSENPPTEEEFRALYLQATREQFLFESDVDNLLSIKHSVFAIPEWINYEEGHFEHQGRAIDAWCLSNFRGVLEMATGSGKTIAAMICAHRLYSEHKPLLIVIAAPYIPLIEQWCGEIEQFGLKPVNITTANGRKERARILQKVKRQLRMGMTSIEIIIVSHRTLCTHEFQDILESFDCERLLIGDEAHNLGSFTFVSNPPEFFEHRLGLSATPVRQYDDEGTKAIFDFFGPIVFQFTLEEAIGNCLVEYEYYVHPVYLSDHEMDEWYDITYKIKQNAWRQEDGKPGDYLVKLFRDRRVLLETAQGKIQILSELLDKEDLHGLQHTLIYATDKAPEQLNEVNLLLSGKGILFHQLTAEETSNRRKTQNIINSFQNGELQVLTAKRVLDEGVNIPQITKAFILASTTVERQWIQRRGRLLRTCSEIGNTQCPIIHELGAKNLLQSYPNPTEYPQDLVFSYLLLHLQVLPKQIAIV